MLTGRQIREARKMLNWTRPVLGRNTSLPVALIEAIESTDREAWLNTDQEAAVRRAFDEAGVEFTADGPQLREGQA